MLLEWLNSGDILGSLITVITSLGGAWLAVNARLYKLEKEDEISKMKSKNEFEMIMLKISYLEENDKKRCNDYESLYDLCMDIKNSLTEIQGELKMKADKYEK